MPLPRRRALLAALGLGAVALAGGRESAARTVRVEGGIPQRLALSSVDELGIDMPASIEGDSVELAVLTLGSLVVTTGRMVAADGLLLEGEPFTAVIPPGSYPLQLVLARIGNADERVAFVQLKLAAQGAVEWSNATTESATESNDDEIIGYDVESGTGCLFDAAALANYRRELAQGDGVFRGLEQILRSNRRATWTWARVSTDQGSGFVFTSGYGDGYYGSYWGRDQRGVLVSLVTDFELLDWAGLPPEPAVTT
jgi:hypothetical protein